MSDNVLAHADFSARLVLAGGRDQCPSNALRRCVGCAPEPEPSLISRWGSPLRFAVPSVISMGCFSDAHYLYDGQSLWEAGLNDPAAHVISTGYNGNRVNMLKAPPAFGIQDYLFILGGGPLQKVSPQNFPTNWGIAKPPIGMTASRVAQETIVIDNFNSSAALWSGRDCSISDQTTTPAVIYNGTGSLQIIPTLTNWTIRKDVSAAPLNLSIYNDGTLSLPTDYISFWVYLTDPDVAQWIWIMFNTDPSDLNPFTTTFTNGYRAAVAFINTSSTTGQSTATFPPGAGGASATTVNVRPQQWVQVAVAKSQFERLGTALNLDWSQIFTIDIQGGNTLSATAPAIYLDDFTQFGGVPIGIGPAAVTGGSKLKYLVTFGNNNTGNDSNPQDEPAIIDHVAEQAVLLSNIPVSTDTQVANRKLWRTSEDGELFFYLDIITDNSTTTYTDVFCSIVGQPIIDTPWMAQVNVGANYYVDGGDGYYFKTTNSSTVNASWQSHSNFVLNQTIAPAGALNNDRFRVTTPGSSNLVQPTWALVPVNGTVTDGSVVWTNIGPGAVTGMNPPDWVTPDSTWASVAVFDLGEKILPLKALNNDAFKVTVAGNSGPVEPDWDAIAVGNTIVDGTVTWQNIGPLTTTDGTAIWACVGLNASPALGTDQVQYDNSVFPAGCTDATYFQGSMFVIGDPMNPNWIYVSTPGKAEGYADIIRVGSKDDPLQRIVTWDLNLWVISTRYIYPLNQTTDTSGNVSWIPGEHILGAEGTSWPFTVVTTPAGIVYRAVSGIRLFNNATNDLIGFVQISPIERGRTVENVGPFQPIVAAIAREEIIFSDGIVSFGYSLVAQSWRMIGLGFNAIIYHDEIEVVHAAIPACVVDFESPGNLLDNGQPVTVEWQTASDLADGTQTTLVKRVYLDVDLAGQILTPTLLVDNTDYTLPRITNAARGTIVIPVEKAGRMFGLRFNGNVSQRVSLYETWSETRTGR